jgi:putative ABC transport system permease protein
LRVITFYTWAMLWHDRQRYMPGVLAVAFSALLITVQCGLLLGMFTFASLPVDHAPLAHIWVGGPNLISVDLGRPLPEDLMSRLAVQPEVKRCEVFVQSFTNWVKADGAFELAMIIGSRLEDDALGAMQELSPETRAALREPNTVVIDDSDMARLGVQQIGDLAQIADRRVRVVGLIHGYRGIAGCYIFCSIETARSLLRLGPDQANYFLGHCANPEDAQKVVERLRVSYPDLTAFTRDELSLRSRLHWLTKTKAGIALGYAAALGLLVGAVVTSQTLYAATAASLREYAVLWALGIPLGRMAALVLTQSFWVGVIGILLALPGVYALAQGGDLLGVTVMVPPWLLAGAVVITLVMAVGSGMVALRLLWQMEPVTLLR